MITNRNVASNAAALLIHFEQVNRTFAHAQRLIDPFVHVHRNIRSRMRALSCDRCPK